jgi:hypothetical protein
MMSFLNSFRILLFVFAMAFFSACGSGSSSGDFLDPSALAVDSTNDRLFAVQQRGELLAFEASSLDDLTDQQPAIADDGDDDIDTEDALSQALPQLVSQLGVFASGTTSRIFLLGMETTSAFEVVFNQIQVLDFDGTSFSEASFSPISLDDQNGIVDDEIDNALSDLVVDQTHAQIYVTDATAGLLYIYSAVDGTAVQAPLAIGGIPRGMSLDGNNLYICNSSADAAEQVVSVINVTDFSENEINLAVPCDEIAVAHNDNGTLLIAKNSDTNAVLIQLLDTATFAVTPLPSADTTVAADGELVSGSGISSTIGDIVIAKETDGVLSVYLSEVDGNVEFLSIPADLSSFTLTTAATLFLDANDGAIYLDTDGTALSVFFITGSGALLQIDVGTDNVDAHS